eukprot:4924664-Pleurochrysis_carterae.AAC.1
MVSARSVAPPRLACLEPLSRMYSAKRVSVSVLYSTPPSSAGSTNGTLSVSATKSPNHASAVSVLRASVASSRRALKDARSAAMNAAACAVGSPFRHLSGACGPSGPASPISSERRARDSAAACRVLGRAVPVGTIGRASSFCAFAHVTTFVRRGGASLPSTSLPPRAPAGALSPSTSLHHLVAVAVVQLSAVALCPALAPAAPACRGW